MGVKNSDIIIIGGGIIGLSCAYYLANEGKSITVIDKGDPKKASSHANCGLIAPSHAMPMSSPDLIWKALKWMRKKDSPFYIKPQINFKFWAWLISFARNARSSIRDKNKIGKDNLLMSSKTLFEELITEHKINCNWSSEGVMYLFLTKEAFDAHGEQNLRLAAFNKSLKATAYIGKELYDKDPAINHNVYGGWLYPIDASIKPDEFIAELSQLLEKKGVNFISAEVLGFDKKNKEVVQVRTASNTYAATQYILATGAWSPTLAKQLGINLPVYPAKGYSITMEKPSDVPKTACLLAEHKVVVTPFKDSYRLGGTLEFNGFNSGINKDRAGALKKAAELYLNKPYTNQVLEEWFGFRPMTNNDLPIIDFAPNYQNILIAAGHNMVGISMATATGKLATELLLGKKPHIDPLFYQFN